MTDAEASDQFENTRWSLLGALHQAPSSQREAALNRLISIYWKPVFAHLRTNGLDYHTACDTTQSFFADVVLSRALFDIADPQKGKLRTLILAALDRHRIDQFRRANVSPVRRPIPMSALDSMERAFTDRLPVSGPSASFKELWAAAIMEDAISRTEHHYKTQGRIRHWMAFEARVLRPATTRTEAPPLSQLAGELDFNHPADVAAAVQQVKHRVSIFIRDVIAETIGREDDIEEEYAALKQAFE